MGRPTKFKKPRPTRINIRDEDIHYRAVEFLSKFVTPRGGILPASLTGCNTKRQRKITNAIKRARAAGLMPFLGR